MSVLAVDAAVLVATIVAVATLLGTVRQDRPASVEHHLPAVTVVLALVGVVAATWAAWAVRDIHPSVSLGISIAVGALLLPVWAGWSWLPPVVRAGALAIAPLAIGGWHTLR